MKEVKETSFNILNHTEKILQIVQEPETTQFELPSNEEITVKTDCCDTSIVLRTFIKDGKVSIAIWDNNSFYKVYYKGNNAFEK